MSNYEMATLALQAVGGIAVFATLWVYNRQLKVMGLQLSAMQASSKSECALALIEFLQSPEIRAARQCVREQLSSKTLSLWSLEERQHASTVTANYDVVAALLKSGIVEPELITTNWGPSIKHCYEVLQPFVQEHRAKPGANPEYWANFDWLYEKVCPKKTVQANAGNDQPLPQSVTPGISPT